MKKIILILSMVFSVLSFAAQDLERQAQNIKALRIMNQPTQCEKNPELKKLVASTRSGLIMNIRNQKILESTFLIFKERAHLTAAWSATLNAVAIGTFYIKIVTTAVTAAASPFYNSGFVITNLVIPMHYIAQIDRTGIFAEFNINTEVSNRTHYEKMNQELEQIIFVNEVDLRVRLKGSCTKDDTWRWLKNLAVFGGLSAQDTNNFANSYKQKADLNTLQLILNAKELIRLESECANLSIL